MNLTEVATGFAGQAKAASNYKRIQRFLRWFEVDDDQIAQLVVRLVKIPKPWVLSVDRTRWEFGAITINILMLGVVHRGVAFPLFWQLLDKRGNSNTQERFELLVTVLSLFAPEDIAYLTADREFLGKDWFGLLQADPATRFRIRIRESELLWESRRSLKTASSFKICSPSSPKCYRVNDGSGDIGFIWQDCDLTTAHYSSLPRMTLPQRHSLTMPNVGALKPCLAI